MAYTAVSDNEYITGDQLELKMKKTLTTGINAYSEEEVMIEVNQAEAYVNTYCGQTFSGTIPSGVVAATLSIAQFFMYQQMFIDKKIKEMPLKWSDIEPFVNENLADHKVKPNYDGDYSLGWM